MRWSFITHTIGYKVTRLNCAGILTCDVSNELKQSTTPPRGACWCGGASPCARGGWCRTRAARAGTPPPTRGRPRVGATWCDFSRVETVAPAAEMICAERMQFSPG
eukprot:scaffold59026_cov48-Phaeocystis_antarctica.AAC.2